MNVCQLDHGLHDTILVETVQGPFHVFDPKYAVHPGLYCPGQDAVSDRLLTEGFWELHDSKPIADILDKGDRAKLVIDFGAHIGWYTIMAAKAGYRVLAIDADIENLRLLGENARLHGVGDKVTVMHAWVAVAFTRDGLRSSVELVKVDLESNDRHAVNACWPFIDRVENLFVEICPIWRDDYPELVDRLVGAGFSAFYPNGDRFDHDYRLSQFNLRLSR